MPVREMQQEAGMDQGVGVPACLSDEESVEGSEELTFFRGWMRGRMRPHKCLGEEPSEQRRLRVGSSAGDPVGQV